MSNKMDCNIILDLLPLYHDHVVSKETSKAVEKHLIECENCKKEYESLSAELPLQSEISTKEKFTNMLKKQKRRRIVSFVFAVILVCGVIGGGIYTLTVPCLVNVPQDEIEILRVYKYTDDDKMPNNTDVFWVLGIKPNYNSPTLINADIIVSEDGKRGDLQYTIKVPIIHQRSEDKPYKAMRSEINVYDEYKNIETLRSNGEVVWDKGAEVPDYVYPKNAKNLTECEYDIEKGIIRVEYKNGDFIHWDLDGNIVSEGNYNNY